MTTEKDGLFKDRTFGDVTLPPPLPPVNIGKPDPKDLGPLEQLKGVWRAKGTGWNMIALPFQAAPSPPAGFKFRLLMNQYDEELKFIFVDDAIKNRGLLRVGDPDSDQVVAALDYQQKIAQIAVDDCPPSTDAGKPGLAIHHEPGLWLWEKNRRVKDDEIQGDVVSEVELTIARLASIPHGNSVLAIGSWDEHSEMPDIPPISGLPSGRFEDVKTPDYDFKTDPYLAPYLHYINKPFMGTVDPAVVIGFPGFNPADMNEILRFANDALKASGVNIVKTTRLTVDTTRKSGGIANLPFSVREALPVSMKATFWIQELDQKDDKGRPKLRLQYSQVVMLQFFRTREDQLPGLAVWPHISIATLEREPADYSVAQA